jgi:Rieske Fe-S protein
VIDANTWYSAYQTFYAYAQLAGPAAAGRARMSRSRVPFDSGLVQAEAIPSVPALTRRAALSAAVAGLVAPCCGSALAQAPAQGDGQASPGRKQRPKKGDKLVFAGGEHAGKPVTLTALTEGGPQAMAWAVDPENGDVRDGSRLNQILLVKLAEDSLGEATRARAAAGVVAYSATCTHALCPVTEWRKDGGILHCPCHGSEFDPRDNGKVVNGPALKGLAALPLTQVEGILMVAGPFAGKIGTQA